MGQSIKAWTGATGVVAVLIAIVGWFLLISPTIASTADIRANIESEGSRTAILTQQLKTLSTEYDNLDDTLAKLKDLSVQVPTTADAASFRRVVVERAATSGVTITLMSTGVSTAVTPPATTSSGTSTSGSATATPSASPSPSPSKSPTATDATNAAATLATESGQVLVGIPLDVTIVGTYDAARAFIASMQGTDGRLFLVYAFNLVTQPDAPASNGRPATVSGDVELFLQGNLVVLTAPTSTDTGPVVVPVSPALPSTERNPFTPVVQAAPVG